MATRVARREARKERLTRARVLQAALALADEAGIDALTMRSTSERLGSEPMSLYRHVRNKEDMLDGLIDLVFGEVELPRSTSDWKRAMRQRAIAVRKVLSRHPWALALVESRVQPGPENLRHHDWVLGVLRRAGFSGALATHAYNTLDSYIYGFVLQERNLPFKNAAELAEIGPMMLRQIPADVYPNLRAIAEELIAARFDYGKEFEYGLDLILDALARSVR
jgi:AcrR family transcriptional regulator